MVIKRKRKLGARPAKAKVLHHVVPKAWQRLFASQVFPDRPYYFDLLSGRASGPEGPGNKMAQDYANAVFDGRGFQIDDLEDRFGREETRLFPKLKAVLGSGRIDPVQRQSVAEFVAMQCCRYPDLFEPRLDRGRETAIELAAAHSASSFAEFENIICAAVPGLPRATLTTDDYARLKAADSEQLDKELDDIVYGHLGRIDGLNPMSMLDAIPEVANRLAAAKWELISALPQDAFVLSDRPVPDTFSTPFSVALGPRLALLVWVGTPSAPGVVVASVQATSTEAKAINDEARGRAKRWLCGAIPF